ARGRVPVLHGDARRRRPRRRRGAASGGRGDAARRGDRVDFLTPTARYVVPAVGVLALNGRPVPRTGTSSIRIVCVSSVTLEQLEADPHAFLAEIRPVGWVEPLGGWLVTGRELAIAVMRDHEAFTVDDPRFSTGRVVGPSMLTRDGPEHARHRDPFVAPFRLAEIRARYAPLVAAEVDALIDAFAHE